MADERTAQERADDLHQARAARRAAEDPKTAKVWNETIDKIMDRQQAHGDPL